MLSNLPLHAQQNISPSTPLAISRPSALARSAAAQLAAWQKARRRASDSPPPSRLRFSLLDTKSPSLGSPAEPLSQEQTVPAGHSLPDSRGNKLRPGATLHPTDEAALRF